jgi:UDP-glucose 4-epimerase
MAILVTGGAGFIGRHLVRACLGRGLEVVVLDDLSTGDASSLPAGVPLVRGDVADASLLWQVLGGGGIDTVVHLAALTRPDAAPDAAHDYYRANTWGACVLAQACVVSGVQRLVLASSAAMYAPSALPVDEDAPLRQTSTYAASKSMAERMLRDVAGDRLAWAALRYFNVAGADPQGRTGPTGQGGDHLVRRACQAALGERAALDIYGEDHPTPDGTALRDFIHVDDLAAAHLAALDRMEPGRPLTFNLGTGTGSSVREVVQAVERAAGRRIPIRVRPRRMGEAFASIADMGRARQALGWTPRFALDDIVQHSLAWERARQSGLAEAQAPWRGEPIRLEG